MNSSQPVPAYERGTRQRIFRTLLYRTGILHSQSIAQVTNQGDIAGNKLYDKRYARDDGAYVLATKAGRLRHWL